jgi:hypothetical protein
MHFVTGLGPPSSIPEKGCQPGNVAVEQQHYPAGSGPKGGRRWDRVPGLPGCADQCRMTNDGNVTGQQYSIRTEYAASAAASMKKTPPTAKVPQLQRVTRKYKSQVPQPQRFTRSTLGLHWGISTVPPGYVHRGTGRGRKSEGSRKTEAGRRPGKRTTLAVRQHQTTTRSTGERHRSTTWVGRRQSATNSGTFPVNGRASVRASPNISRRLASQGSRGRSPSRWS